MLNVWTDIQNYTARNKGTTRIVLASMKEELSLQGMAMKGSYS